MRVVAAAPGGLGVLAAMFYGLSKGVKGCMRPGWVIASESRADEEYSSSSINDLKQAQEGARWLNRSRNNGLSRRKRLHYDFAQTVRQLWHEYTRQIMDDSLIGLEAAGLAIHRAS